MHFRSVFQQTRYHGDVKITERQSLDARFDVAVPIGTIAGCGGRFLAARDEREPGVLDVLDEQFRGPWAFLRGLHAGEFLLGEFGQVGLLPIAARFLGEEDGFLFPDNLAVLREVHPKPHIPLAALQVNVSSLRHVSCLPSLLSSRIPPSRAGSVPSWSCVYQLPGD